MHGSWLGGAAASLALMAAAGAQVAAAPFKACVQATAACTEWVALAGGPARAMVYRSYSLSRPNPAIRRALVMIHGTLRNGDLHFETATGAAFFAHALDDTMVIAPAFRSADGDCKDKLAPHEVSWSCHGDSWRSGGNAASDPKLTSFDFMDEIVRRLADKRLFPNLRTVVIAGHSAGGQFVARYGMANRIHGKLGLGMRYVVANPSSYAWPDASRPLPEGDADPARAAKGWELEDKPHAEFRYGPFAGAEKVEDYDLWPYGLRDRKGGYTAGMSDEQLKAQLAARPTTYLLSQVDVLPLGGFDDSDEAMAQGPTRRARGEAFVRYITTTLHAKARAVIVEECGHNNRCVFTDPAVLPVIFPND
jgi:pimeloyl-ACP methyl ester carboxylesterase